MSKLLIKVSRQGVEIGSYTISEALRLIDAGTLKCTDHYWHTGMVGWACLSQLKQAEAIKAKAEAELKDSQTNAKAVSPAVNKEGLFQCRCCRKSFSEPTNPGLDFGKGIFCWFLAMILGGALTDSAYRSMRSRFFESDTGGLGFGFLLGFVFVMGLLVVGVAFVFSAVLSSPRCPNCASTDFGRPAKAE
jgi:hypothetical protein